MTFPQEQDEMRPEDMLTEGTTTSQETQTQTTTSEGEKKSEQNTTASEELESSSKEDASAKENTGKKDTIEGGAGEEESRQDTLIAEENIDKNSSEAQLEESAEVETIPIEPLKPYQTQYEELYKVYREMESSMVTVTAVHSDVDWFNNTYQSEGTTAGVIIANNNREL